MLINKVSVVETDKKGTLQAGGLWRSEYPKRFFPIINHGVIRMLTQGTNNTFLEFLFNISLDEQSQQDGEDEFMGYIIDFLVSILFQFTHIPTALGPTSQLVKF